MKDWDALYEECIHCQKCGLAETRTNVVFGEGARDAEVMFIGEALLKPKIIVCLGRIAAMKLIKEDFKITREHGQWLEKAGVWMMAMYHPSALLRDPRKRPESFEDLKSLQAKIREVCVRTY